MITITESAANKIKEISEAEELGHTFIRLRVIGGGCAGFSYDLYFDNTPTELDEQFSAHGATVIIDPLSYQYLDGITVDYLVKGLAEGFHFENPNVSSTCGCGNSFSA
jgi:iron-sulfur cluster insertion protein